MIKFTKNPKFGTDYEASGDFRKEVTFIRISHWGGKWRVNIFRNDNVKGELYVTTKTLKDAKETCEHHFGV
jgi:hypothetical protein